MLFEDLIAKRKRDDFLQFIEHDLRIIVGVDIVVFLPRLQFLHKCAGLVFSADDGFLEGLDDNRDFMLLMGFLGEDDRIGDVRIKFGRNGRRKRLDVLDVFGFGVGVGGVGFVKINHSEVVDVIDHDC